MTCHRFVDSRNAKKRCPRFRASSGPRRALGWIPASNKAFKIEGDAVIYLNKRYRFWKHREIEGRLISGSFVADARGRWYVCLSCEELESPEMTAASGTIGIDLGLRTIATTSQGEKLPNLRHREQYARQLGIAQRARKKNRARAIHAKIANARKDQLHKWSAEIAKKNRFIAVGDVSSLKLAKRANPGSIRRKRMGKSVLDAGWGMLRTMLRYKASRHGAMYVDVDERWSTQTCSSCGCISDSSPKGRAGLRIRHWTCSECGVSHDRDINAARNILQAGLYQVGPTYRPLAEGTRTL